jgi:hypothetical protein
MSGRGASWLHTVNVARSYIDRYSVLVFVLCGSLWSFCANYNATVIHHQPVTLAQLGERTTEVPIRLRAVACSIQASDITFLTLLGAYLTI